MLKFVIVLISTCISLVAAEALVRIMSLAPFQYQFHVEGASATFQISSNPILGYEMRPNLRFENYDCHNSFSFTNSLGFRDKERSLEKEGGVIRVVLLGDSVAAGHGLCQFEDIISQQIEKFSDKKLEVINASVGGYCTRAEVELLKTKLLTYSPDIVALLFVDNDYTNSNGTIINSLNTSRRRILPRLAKHSHLVRFLVYRLGYQEILFPELKRNSEAVGGSNVEEGLHELKRLSSQYSFQPVVITWPYFTDDKILRPIKQHAVEIIPEKNVYELAREMSIPVLSLAEAFRRNFKEHKKSRTTTRRAAPRWVYTQGDGVHPSRHGSEVAGSIISKRLIAMPITDSR